jgi:hypothetical protein
MYPRPLFPPAHITDRFLSSALYCGSPIQCRVPEYNVPQILRLCDCASWQILIIKPTRRTNFSNLFWNETLHISDSSSVHHQEFFTVHTVMVYVMTVCRQLSSRIRMELRSIMSHLFMAKKIYLLKISDDASLILTCTSNSWLWHWQLRSQQTFKYSHSSFWHSFGLNRQFH